MVTAMRENMELVHNRRSNEFIIIQAWKFSGCPILTAIAQGMPSKPKSRTEGQKLAINHHNVTMPPANVSEG